MKRRPEPDRPGDTRPYRPVTDDYVVDTLQGLESWRTAGDSLDGDLAPDRLRRSRRHHRQGCAGTSRALHA
jgi:hypothetical protein